MNYGCPNSQCLYYQKNDFVVSHGSYFRSNDSRFIKRYKCRHCGKGFSSATFSLARGQKKRRVNEPLRKLLCSGVSMRRAALLLDVHRTTITRKLIFLAGRARLSQKEFLKKLQDNPITKIQFDDLITSEHTKLKPLCVSLAVDKEKRSILAVEVGQIPSFGRLAEKSRKKYGKRKCFHLETLHKLFKKIKPVVSPEALVESDEHPHYPGIVKKYFKKSDHRSYKGGRGAIVGQGELKKLRNDPLFTLNHSCAILRANINRLFRKTWCTTKDPQMLQHHLDLFVDYYNQILLQK